MIFISIVDKKILLNQTDVDNSVINTIHIEINLTLALQTLINMMYDSERKGTEYSLFTDSLSISNSVLGTGLQDQQTYIPLSGKIDGSKTRIDFERTKIREKKLSRTYTFLHRK